VNLEEGGGKVSALRTGQNSGNFITKATKLSFYLNMFGLKSTVLNNNPIFSFSIKKLYLHHVN
jgi:hypothetical protein